jgi:hypothetical protein
MPLLSGLGVFIFPNFASVQQTTIRTDMFTKITSLLLIVAFISCNKSNSNPSENNEKENIKASHWLLGTWENKSSEGNLIEKWKKMNDSTYEGQSFFIKGKDTLHFEIITLQQKEEELYYNTLIKGQNNDEVIPFKMTLKTEKELVFENPKHDYPQKISYKQISKDSVVTEISGLQLGQPSSEKYLMLKIK